MLPARLLKTAKTLYLYSDGHAVLVHEKADKDAGRISWVTLHQSIGVRARFDGRLIVSHVSALAMLLAADAVECREASISAGSENTRAKGIAVGSVAFNFGHGYVYISTFPGLISSEFTYQFDHSEQWADVAEKSYWSDYRISETFADKAALAA